MIELSSTFLLIFIINMSVLHSLPARSMVWADSRSLATTCEITIVFSSSGYLDVSVLRVRISASRRDDDASRHQVSPFGHLRITDCVHLPAAYRSLPRPSSPSKA